MKLTKKGEYALRAMIALAGNGRESMTISQIATQQEIPKKFLEQILLALKAAGLVHSKAGPRGGYELDGLPEAISVRAILDAVDEPISVRSAAAAENCDAGLELLLADIRNYVREKLQTVNLQQLCSKSLPQETVEALMYYI